MRILVPPIATVARAGEGGDFLSPCPLDSCPEDFLSPDRHCRACRRGGGRGMGAWGRMQRDSARAAFDRLSRVRPFSLCVYIYIYIYAYIYIYIYTYTHTYAHTRVFTYTYITHRWEFYACRCAAAFDRLGRVQVCRLSHNKVARGPPVRHMQERNGTRPLQRGCVVTYCMAKWGA